jgi:hypothetical protein
MISRKSGKEVGNLSGRETEGIVDNHSDLERQKSRERLHLG